MRKLKARKKAQSKQAGVKRNIMAPPLKNYPLYAYDRNEINNHLASCESIYAMKKYLIELEYEHKTSFKFDKSNPFIEIFKDQFPDLVPMIDYEDFSYVYNDFLQFIEVLKSKVLSLEEIEREEKSSVNNIEASEVIEEKENLALKPLEKLVWIGTQSQLVYLFDKLVEKKYINREDVYIPFYAVIVKCFKDKDGKPFKTANLRQAHQNRELNKVRGAKKIDEIIEKINSEE